MTSQVFYRKWRPQLLADVVGQEQVTQTLQNALSAGRIAHAYLFCGPRGTGKTSTGRILSKAVNCLTNDGKGEPCNTCAMCQAITEGRALDVIEVDAASNRGINEIRDLRQKVNYSPSQARRKVYIIDEVHMLTPEAANALLKTLEEPPPYVIFILATTEIHKVLPTIMSRCQRFDFRRLSQSDVVNKLAQIAKQENIKIQPEALRLIARAATGSLRDAENILEQMVTFYGDNVSLKQVQSILGITGDKRIKELVRNMINRDVSAGVATINSVNSDGLDLRQFNRELVEYLRCLLLDKTGAEGTLDLTAEDLAELKEMAEKAALPQVLKAIRLFSRLELSLDTYSSLPLELALVDATLPATEDKPAVRAAEPELHSPAARTPMAGPTAFTPSRPVSRPPVPRPTTPRAPVTKPPASHAPLPPQAAETTPPPPLEAGNELEQLKRGWWQFIRGAPPEMSRTPAAALLRSARPKAIEADIIVLSFRYPLHKEQMEKPENQQIAEKIVSHFLKRACHVRCVYEPEDNHLVEEALRIGAQIIQPEEK